VATLLASPELRRKLGRDGERRAKARYSWSRVAAETEKAYQLAVAGTAHASSLEPMEGAAL
jgi:D-inositol-3-phosphate glycosyltransferase